MNNLNKVWEGLENFKNKTILFAFILLITAFFETLGIGVIYQILRIITDTGFIENNYYLTLIKENLNINNNELIIIILVSILLIFLVKNTLSVLFIKWQQNFLNFFDVYVSDKLFTYYINQPYEKYIKNNSSTYVRNLTVEISNYKGALQHLMTLMSEGIILFSICALLIYVNPIVSLIIFCILLFTCSLYFIGPINNFLKKSSKERLFFSNKYTKFLIQGLASVKEIRVYQSENEARSEHYNSKKRVNDLNRHLVVLNAIPRNLFEVITFLLLGSYIAYFTLNDQNLLNIIPTAGVYLAAAYKILPCIVKILNSVNTLKFLSASIEHIYQELKNAKKIYDKKKRI